jgi:signal transduction histidine kinase
MDAQETRILTAIVITAVVLGIVLTMFIISMIRQQRKNLQLHNQNILAEITHIEKERARIAQDLHDELGPILSAVKMRINSFDLSDEEDKIQKEKTNQHLDNALKRIREISFDLMPTSLLRKGLKPALKEMVDYLNSDSRTNFSLNCADDLKLSEQNSVNMYRIIQEVVHNSIKHAEAKELKIDVTCAKDMIILSIHDNGKGFDYNRESAENTGFGLKSLLRRTEFMNGKMYVESAAGKGTSYTFEIPQA